jgi:release factor glutamine methyltransferase
LCSEFAASSLVLVWELEFDAWCIPPVLMQASIFTLQYTTVLPYTSGVRILDLIDKTTPYLAKQGIESPRLTIELMLAHVLQKKRLQIYLEFERELDAKTMDTLREMVRRRVAGEPLQYITGETEFCGLKFAVDKRVLIPRPETELLVEAVLERLKSPGMDAPAVRPCHIVDIGTGSGCIAISLAKKLPEAQITAIDVSPEALIVAQSNANRHGVEKNIRFLESDLVSNLSVGFKADAVVSNPPYIASGDWAKLPREVKDFEPVRSLIAGGDGLEVYGRLVMSARRLLSPSSFMVLEMGAGQRPAIENLFVSADYKVAQVVKDLQGHERVIVVEPKS